MDRTVSVDHVAGAPPQTTTYREADMSKRARKRRDRKKKAANHGRKPNC